jgi:RNA polymerase sigma-70 factor, Bacteroides expansion family 1
MENDDTLISLLKEGDMSSFARLYEKYSGKVYNFVMKISHGDCYLAEEMVQNVFVKIWTVRETVDTNKSFPSFLCTIAKNMVVNAYLHKMQEATYQNKIKERVDFSLDYTTDKDVDYQFLENYIDSLIEKLPPARRKIFILSRKEFMSNKEIAKRLCLSENTVESQLTKAISFIKSSVKSDYGLALLPILWVIL